MGLSFCAVLVRPAKAANVGAAARALKNFGWSDLRLVGTRAALPGGEDFAEAAALAWNAVDVLEAARVFDTLAEAVADLHLSAAATARRAPRVESLEPRAFAAEALALGGGARVGVVFGPEAHGLANEELDLCRLRLRIPSFGEQPSLNLAQAVVILSHEMCLAVRDPAPTGEPEAATEGEVQRLVDVARDLLLRAGYLNPQQPEHVLGELRRLLGRCRPTSREVSLLLGLCAQLDWAGRQRPD